MAGSVPMTLGSFSRIVYPKAFDNWITIGKETYPNLVGECFTILTSSQALEQDTILRGLGTMQQTGSGEAVTFDSMEQFQTKFYTFPTYQTAFAITRDLIDDGKAFNVLEAGARETGKVYTETQNIRAYQVLNNAFTSEKSADGAILISTSHPSKGFTQSNQLSTNATFSEASIEQMSIETSNTLNDRGIRMPTYITKCVVPRALQFEAIRVTDNYNRPGTSDRDINASYVAGIIPEVVVIDYLTSDTAWFVLTNHNDRAGLKFYNRRTLEPREDKDFHTMNLFYGASARFTAGCSEYRGIRGSTGV